MDDVKGKGTGHELTDASHGAVLKAGAALVALVVFALVLMWLLFLAFRRGDARPSNRSPLAASRPAPSGPAGPLLQASPARDLAEKRRAEDDVLTSYGWVDADKGVVRIPIERAMDLLAQRGLPVKRGGNPAP